MYQNTVEKPRLDLAGALRTQDGLGDAIATELLPTFGVGKKSGNMPSLVATNDQIMDIKHAPKTDYQRVEATLGNKSYNCEEAGIEVPLSAEDYDVVGQDEAEAIATQQGADILLSARENALASVLTGATGETTFSGQVTEPDSAENWGESGGKPIDDIQEADSALTLRHGQGPRWLVISQYDYEDLQLNDQIRTEYRRIVGQSNAAATRRRLSLDELALTLGVDRILVGVRRKNTAAKGQTPSYAYIWPARYALLLRGVANPGDLREPVLGRTFVWDEANASITGGEQVRSTDPMQAMMVHSYRDSTKASDIIRVSEYLDMKLLNTVAAQLIKLPADD